MPAYYNENDPKAATWLRELIRDGLIAPGDVDERSATEVKEDDVRSYTQVHFFAGIGGWSLALPLAGWPDEQPVWTGSCPCQPFSVAGKRGGKEDERHLWPEMFRLMRARRPVVTFGEQVEGAVRLGWIDGVSADLESENFAFGFAVLGAHSIGAPHIRQRLYWVSDADGGLTNSGQQRQQPQDGIACRMADPASPRCDGPFGESEAETQNETRMLVPRAREQTGGLGDANDPRSQRRGVRPDAKPSKWTAWAASAAIECSDGRTRRIPVEPSLFPLADGLPNRVVALRGAGNAIVPQVAAEFIQAYCDVRA